MRVIAAELDLTAAPGEEKDEGQHQRTAKRRKAGGGSGRGRGGGGDGDAPDDSGLQDQSLQAPVFGEDCGDESTSGSKDSSSSDGSSSGGKSFEDDVDAGDEEGEMSSGSEGENK